MSSEPVSYIKSIRLTNFRNYNTAHLDDLDKGFIVLTGDNGAGKTNILEAVSYLSPGRGLRGAKIADLQKNDVGNKPNASWAVSSNLQTDFGDIKIGCGKNPENQRKLTKIQGEIVKNQATLTQYLSCVWLTPQMDSLFRGGASERRRFIDRLLLTYDPSHAGRMTRYENALSQRSKILKDDTKTPDPTWLKGLEVQMSETGVAIAAARREFLDRLQTTCFESKNENFPIAGLSFNGTIENSLKDKPAIEVEDHFLRTLEKSRELDAMTGGASIGPHRTDLRVTYLDKDMEANQCSTGEQKLLLVGLVLAHTKLLHADQGRPPIILLDEIAAHLDKDRIAALFQTTKDLGCQTWVTGTDRGAFTTIESQSQFFKVSNGSVATNP